VSITPCVVLDTNVVLDWLVFDDPHTRILGLAVTTGALAWLQTEPMWLELQRVLDYPAIQPHVTDRTQVLHRASRHSLRVEAATPAPLPLRCTDPDDQGFIDLALTHRGCLLISRDKAVLALRKTALARGLQILTPAQWLASQSPGLP